MKIIGLLKKIRALHYTKIIIYSLKWAVIAVPIGVIIGVAVSLFRYAILLSNEVHDKYSTLFLLLLPVAGLAIVFLYKKAGFPDDNGTDDVIIAAHKGPEVISWKKAPLIFVTSVITHLFGGSAGCEGASLQIGGGMAVPVAGFLKMGKNDSCLLIMMAMAAAFSGLLGCPLGASVFAAEVAIVGALSYSALLPCIIASVASYGATTFLGLYKEEYRVVGLIDTVKPLDFGQVVILGLCSAVAGIAFCRAMKFSKKIFKERFSNPYLRIIVGGLLVAGITLILGTNMYSGAGYETILQSFSANSMPIYVFIIKIVLTALTLGSGFRGGEILPSFFIGATMGNAVAGILGMPVSVGAAIGFIAVFTAVTNCPIAAIILSAELFGGDGLFFFGTAIIISYMFAIYDGLYSAQMYKPQRLKFRDYRSASLSKGSFLR
ncbi:MAG: chloride channel protein [Ruminococcus sp.]|jgi:H+/Cl- antiporter ClcA|nr:chloride channel protein [Ruminococcus sp.]